jgi:hypothetical protein
MPKLCKAGQQLREQIDDAFPDRSRTSPEGWLGDQRHAARKSDHNPTAEGIVRALTLTLICKPTQPKHLIWRISYGYLPELIRESATLSSTTKLPVGRRTTSGESTQA